MTSKPLILVTRKTVTPGALKLLTEKFDVKLWLEDVPMSREAILKEVALASGIFCILPDKIDEELLNHAPNLKVVSTLSVGYEHIDLEACKKRNIAVGFTPDILTETTAETAIALLLCTSRRLLEANRDVMTGKWPPWTPYYMCGTGLVGSTVGILGMGRIGRSIAEKINAFHPAHLFYHNRNPVDKEKEKSLNAKYVPFEELMSKSDFLIVSCALTPETTHIIDRKAFSLMKPDTILINISRGMVINQDDLYDALKSKRIRSAGLDVVYPEPLPVDHKLLSLDNIVVLPHIGSAVLETRERMAVLAAENIVAGIEGKPLPASAL